ncbi:hypothetical protein NDU88_001452 [Pleurodeles waltl]|uniref:Uncharacterized protein n=1 Tax=Pleurodeles waltl TaxID=8319 RepID=A0AAV7NDE0_PLEWA|nr:hypothetical protein NDU88_001452 [Pleurodeles waltl]
MFNVTSDYVHPACTYVTCLSPPADLSVLLCEHCAQPRARPSAASEWHLAARRASKTLVTLDSLDSTVLTVTDTLLRRCQATGSRINEPYMYS